MFLLGHLVGRKRDTPIVSLLEQGRDPPLLQTRDDGVGDIEEGIEEA
jgi:hypothetical protein